MSDDYSILLYATDCNHIYEVSIASMYDWEDTPDDYYDSANNALELSGAKKPYTMTVIEMEE